MAKPKDPVLHPRLVGVPEDDVAAELTFDRTLGPRQERFIQHSASLRNVVVLRDNAEATRHAGRHKAKRITPKHEPGAERYERNPHEPIKI